ncbi:MAG: GDP-mannose 4,6-dehydratase [Desulfomonilaceae bacterium]
MKSLILGIGGQDGFFLGRSLVQQGFSVIGVLLPEDMGNETIPHLPQNGLSLVQASICDHDVLRDIIRLEQPTYLYNFAGISFIPYSWDAPRDVEKINGYAVGEILHIIKEESPSSRFFQACSSEMFGHHPKESPQNEETPFDPDNPYGSSKVFAYYLVKNYREHYGIFACSGILYNHESEWRPPRFVSRKITMAAAAIKLGRQDAVNLGSLDSLRDWSYAGDIVEAMQLMMNADEPGDYVLSSGKLHAVRDILDIAFGHVGLDWSEYTRIDESLTRPPESKPLCGDPTKARTQLGWQPKVSFEDMIRLMVDMDLHRLKNG